MSAPAATSPDNMAEADADGAAGAEEPAQKHILIVEDEADLVTLLRYNLQAEGYTVSTAADAESGLALLRGDNRPDLIVLDWMLPGMSGIGMCKAVRADPDVADIPIIMLTARSEETDTIRGLESGADDYMPKPFSVGELAARIRAVLRRTASTPPPRRQLNSSGIEVDITAHSVRYNEAEVKLGPTEFRLLKLFMEHPRVVYSREDLLRMVWGENVYVELRTVDVHIRRLRKALAEAGAPDVIRTVRSAGYSFEPQPAA